MPRRVTLARARLLYDRYRLRYFMDAVEPLHVPPPSAGLRWAWLPANSPSAAMTCFDEDGDPDEVQVHPATMQLDTDLIHELTHIRLGTGSVLACRRGGSRIWRAETLRLAQLGAPLL